VLFHSPYLDAATSIILEDLKEIGTFTRQDLTIPVFHATSIQNHGDDSGDELIISELVDMITQQPVHGETATVLLGTTKFLDLGPGVFPGLGF
ncbi:hypothetical protein B9Z19DRAFT_1002164, partial [Tuber borchii]